MGGGRNGRRSYGKETNGTSTTPRQQVRIGGIKADGTTGRWYKAVDVASDGHGKYTVLIDRRPMKSFKDHDIVVPTERLALAVASEWMLQDAFIKPAALPLTRIATAAIDTIPEDRDLVVSSCMSALNTDSICLRHEDSPTLSSFLDKSIEPINAWFTEQFGAPLTVSYAFGPVKHPTELLEKIRSYISELDDMHLAALEQLILVSKSLALSLGIAHSQVSIQDCIRIARAEEEFQVERWGEIPGAHDLDRADVSVKLSSAALFWRLLLPQPPSKNKV